MPLHFPAQGDSSKCQESCSMWLLESHQEGGGGELFKKGFRKLFKPRMTLSQEPIDSVIQLAKTTSKSYRTRKTIGCFVETIGCLYQQRTNKLNLKS